MNLPIAQKIEKEIDFMIIKDREITEMDLHGISIRNSIITGCSFNRNDMHNSDLLSTKIYDTVYQNVNYRNADIFSLWFSKCKFINVDFTGAGIEDVNFVDCLFENCIINNAGVKNCHFERTNIIGLYPDSSTFSLNTYKDCTINNSRFKGSFIYQIFDNCQFGNVKMDISLIKYNHGICNENQIMFYSSEREIEELSATALVKDCLNHKMFLDAAFVAFNFESYINPSLALSSINAIEDMLQHDILMQESELQHFKNLFNHFYITKAIAPMVLYKMFEQLKHIYLNSPKNVAYNKCKNMIYLIANSLFMDFNDFCELVKKDICAIPKYIPPAYAWIHYENEPQITLCSLLNSNKTEKFKRIDSMDGSFWECLEIGENGLEILTIFFQILGICIPIVYSEIKEKRKKTEHITMEKKDLNINVSYEISESKVTELIQSTCNLLNNSDLFVSDMQGYNNENIKEIKIEYHIEKINYK